MTIACVGVAAQFCFGSKHTGKKPECGYNEIYHTDILFYFRGILCIYFQSRLEWHYQRRFGTVAASAWARRHEPKISKNRNRQYEHKKCGRPLPKIFHVFVAFFNLFRHRFESTLTGAVLGMVRPLRRMRTGRGTVQLFAATEGKWCGQHHQHHHTLCTNAAVRVTYGPRAAGRHVCMHCAACVSGSISGFQLPTCAGNRTFAGMLHLGPSYPLTRG